MASYESPQPTRSHTCLPEQPGSGVKTDHHAVGEEEEHTPARNLCKGTGKCPHGPRRKGFPSVDEHIGDTEMRNFTDQEQQQKRKDDMATKIQAEAAYFKKAEDLRKVNERAAAESRAANRLREQQEEEKARLAEAAQGSASDSEDSDSVVAPDTKRLKRTDTCVGGQADFAADLSLL